MHQSGLTLGILERHSWRCALSIVCCFALVSSAAPPAWAENTDPAAAGCALYRQGKTVTFPIGVYHAPPIHGGIVEMQPVTVGRDYLGPFGFLNLTGEVDEVAAFEVEIDSGLPPNIPRYTPPSQYAHLRLLIEGLAYSQPGYALSAVAGAPVGEPLTIPSFEVIGPGPSGFSELQVEDQADYVTAEDQLFAEIGPAGEVSAVMSCRRPGTVPNPSCVLYEQVGLFATKASFNRTELPRLDLIRERVAGFVVCLTAD